MWNLIFWILCLLINFGLLAIVFYALLCLTDLEVDQVDPFVATANINRFIRRQHLIDVTEVFRNLNADKKLRMIKLGVYMIFFIICVFRVVLFAVNFILNDDDDIDSY